MVERRIAGVVMVVAVLVVVAVLSVPSSVGGRVLGVAIVLLMVNCRGAHCQELSFGVTVKTQFIQTVAKRDPRVLRRRLYSIKLVLAQIY